MKIWAVVPALLLILVPNTILADSGPKNSMGLGIFAGREAPDGLGWRSYEEWYEGKNIILVPSYGWALGERWHLALEGNIGWYRFEAKKRERTTEAFTLGLGITATYDLLRFERWIAYADIGVGLSYWSDTPGPGLLVKDKYPGFIQYGIGAKIPISEGCLFKVGYRFAHTSAIASNDTGVNNHGVFLAVMKSF